MNKKLYFAFTDKPQVIKEIKNEYINNGEADGTRTRNIQIDSLVL